MSSVIVCLGFTGSVVGIIQGIVWTILSLCAILIRYDSWIPEPSDQTHTGILSNAILVLYLQGNSTLKNPFEDVIITRDVFKYWLFFYLIVSVAWCVLSMWLFYVFLHKKKKIYKTACLTWTGCTCLISIFDLVLTILLGVDYKYVVELIDKGKGVPVAQLNVYVILATAVVMSIAARGFVLWLVNVIVSIALAVLQYWEKDEVSDILRHHINAYEANSAFNHEKDNYGFDWEFDKDATPSHVSNTETLYAQSLPRLDPIPPIQTTNERLAKIGKERGTVTPTNVVPPKPPNSYLHPRVPSPDYSPVLDRKHDPVRSTLKVRTQNVYGTQF